MVTRKQSKEYERLHNVLLDTYHVKEKGREAILIYFEGLAEFNQELFAHTEIVFDEQNRYHASIDQQQFLESLLIDYRVVSNKTKTFDEKTRIIYEEVNNCMDEMMKVQLELSSEDTDKKTSEIILVRMNERIEEIKSAITQNILEMSEIINGLDACKLRYNSRKN